MNESVSLQGASETTVESLPYAGNGKLSNNGSSTQMDWNAPMLSSLMMGIAPPESPRQLIAALIRTMKAASSVAKSGNNRAQNYKYITEGDAIEAVRAQMLENGLVSIPSVSSVETVDHITTVAIRYELFHESGESYAIMFYGTGKDASRDKVTNVQISGDKALYKAYAGANKYFLLKLFQLPSDDDAENERGGSPKQEAEDDFLGVGSKPAMSVSPSVASKAIATVGLQTVNQINQLDQLKSVVAEFEKATKRDDINESWKRHKDFINNLQIKDSAAHANLMLKVQRVAERFSE